MIEFIIRDYDDLEPVLFIEKYQSAIWNNKYFTAGDFELILTPTEDIKTNIKQNYFIQRSGTNEIGVIMNLSYSSTLEGGQILTITGKMAQELLGRRVIWEKTLLNGNLATQMAALINSNAISPTDANRKIASLTEIQATYGLEVDRLTNASVALKAIYGGTAIDTLGTDGPNGFKTVPATYTTIESGHILAWEYTGGATAAKVLQTELYGQPHTGARNAVVFEGGMWKKQETVYSWANVRDLFPKNLLTTNFSNFTKIIGGTTYQGVEVWSNTLPGNPPDQKPFLPAMNCLTKEVYETGAYGCTIKDQKLYIRVFWSDLGAGQPYLEALNLYWGGSSYAFKGYSYAWLALNIPNGSNQYPGSQFVRVFGGGFISGSATYTTLGQDLSVPTDADTYTFNAAVSTGAYMFLEQTIINGQAANWLQYVANWTTDKTIYLQVAGENLEEKIEELLQSEGVALYAYFDNGNICVSFREGLNRTINQSAQDPIIFRRTLDNLLSYQLDLAEGTPNVARVLGKNNNADVWGHAGAGGGLTRRETYVNRSEESSYIGEDYTVQLATEGKLNLQGFTAVMNVEIKTDFYEYRTNYNVGDVITIMIEDLNYTYNVRILEVREFQDATGYSINLVLGS